MIHFSFAAEYDNPLETDLKGDTSGDLETLLVELSKVLTAIMFITTAKKGALGGYYLKFQTQSPALLFLLVS